MKKITSTLILVMLSVPIMAQMDLQVEVYRCGTLEDVIYDISDSAKYTTSSLKVTGPIDGRDMMFLRDMCGVRGTDTPTKGILKNLDLGDAIVSESPEVYWSMDGKDYMTSEGNFGCCFLYNCNNLEELVLPSGLEYIDTLALAGCRQLMKIEIPSSVKRIGYGALYGCERITSLVVPDGVFEIGMGAFQKMSRLKYLRIGDGVVEIDNSLILGDVSLETIDFGENFKKFNPVFFYTSTSLNHISVSDRNPHYRSIDGVLFSNDCDTLFTFPVASSLKDYIIPDGVKVIAPYAFYDASSLNSVSLPNSVLSVDSLAFFGCLSLKDVKLNEGLANIRFGAFGAPLGLKTSLKQLALPSSVSLIEGGAFLFNSSLSHLLVDENNTCFSNDENGMFYDKDKRALLYVPSNISDCLIPTTVKVIGDYAFAGAINIPYICMGDQVESIGKGAFAYAYGVHELSFGNSIRSVGDRIVEGCDNISVIYWIASNIEDKSISDCAFEDKTGSIAQKCVLHVSPGCVSYYLAKKGFYSSFDNSSFFAKVVQLDNPDNVKQVFDNHRHKTYYTVDGKISKSDVKGLNIIVLPDGKSFKQIK